MKTGTFKISFEVVDKKLESNKYMIERGRAFVKRIKLKTDHKEVPLFSYNVKPDIVEDQELDFEIGDKGTTDIIIEKDEHGSFGSNRWSISIDNASLLKNKA